MEWKEVNCIIDALDALIEKYSIRLQENDLDDDERSDTSNDLAFAQLLLGNYLRIRDDKRQ